MAVRTPCLRRCSTIRATSPNQEGGEGTEQEEVWMITAESEILFMSDSLMGIHLFFPLKETHFLLIRYWLHLVAQFVGYTEHQSWWWYFYPCRWWDGQGHRLRQLALHGFSKGYTDCSSHHLCFTNVPIPVTRFASQGYLDEYAFHPGQLWRTCRHLPERLFAPGTRFYSAWFR